MTAITKCTDHFSEADVDHEIVIMRLDNGEFFSLSGTAAATWRLINGERERSDLIAILAAEFDANPAQIAADVEDFLASLKKKGLLADS